MSNKSYRGLKLACYSVSVSMSIVGNLPALLFLTFRETFGISYSMLGLLVFICFFVQLVVDLMFSFFSHKFNISKVTKITPVLTFIGLLIYAVWPLLFPDNAYIGLVVGTIIFSSASGFSEVLISPIIAEIPAENPEHEMSKLHSIYAWGVVGVIIFSTLFLLAFGSQNWFVLVFIMMLVPVCSVLLFWGTEIPKMETPKRTSGALGMLKNKGIWLCVICIFLGGSTECTMAQWASGYLEGALGIPKVWGDIFGVAMFALMLGLGRTLYAAIGKNIEKVLFAGTIASTICYLVAAVIPVPLIGLFACAFTGFCSSMLWPGTLVVATDRFPDGGVFIYALMAAGGDFGASVGPQLVGIITDAISMNPMAADFAKNTMMTPEQLGMKVGILVGMLFPLLGIAFYYNILKTKNKQ